MVPTSTSLPLVFVHSSQLLEESHSTFSERENAMVRKNYTGLCKNVHRSTGRSWLMPWPRQGVKTLSLVRTSSHWWVRCSTMYHRTVQASKRSLPTPGSIKSNPLRRKSPKSLAYLTKLLELTKTTRDSEEDPTPPPKHYVFSKRPKTPLIDSATTSRHYDMNSLEKNVP